MIKTCFENGFIKVIFENKSYRIVLPTFEIDGSIVGGADFDYVDEKTIRTLKNGGIEKEVTYVANELTLIVTLQEFCGLSPFVRYMFTLKGEGKLTKNNGKDNICFGGLEGLEKEGDVYEISLANFEQLIHSHLPNTEHFYEADVLDETDFMGPIAMTVGGDYALLTAYEHGSEQGNRFIEAVVKNGEKRNIYFRAVKGTYCNGERVDGYFTPWLHTGFADNRDSLMKAYREFLLKYITENTESRKPYIFYNTWNNQERNRAYRNKPYLDNMNLHNMLAEIDVAHKMGIEVFVIDTGWFGAPGDWEVNLDRFPDGLKDVKKRLDDYGMKLGLWFNPTACALDSKMYEDNKQYIAEYDGQVQDLGVVWESKHCHGICLASDYADYYINKLKQLIKDIGVTYFKWDGIGMEGCNSPNHNHGDETNTPEERRDNFAYKMGLSLCRIANEVCREYPEAIFDFDMTEGGRFLGLGFLAVGKYFLINNGPYYMDFDIPNAWEKFNENVNVFFHPGAARPRICRPCTAYDKIVPQNLFLVHYLPDPPYNAQMNSIASLIIGGNGIWGDLLSLTDEDIAVFDKELTDYKRVRDFVTDAYPKTRGFVGASPEIYEKIDGENTGGVVCIFTKAPGTFTHLTDKVDVDKIGEIKGADSYEIIDGRIKLTVTLEERGAKIVYIIPKGK